MKRILSTLAAAIVALSFAGMVFAADAAPAVAPAAEVKKEEKAPAAKLVKKAKKAKKVKKAAAKKETAPVQAAAVK